MAISKCCVRFIAALCVVAAMTTLSVAEVISVYGDTADNVVIISGSTGTPSGTSLSGTCLVHGCLADTREVCAVLAFELPELSTDISSANLDVTNAGYWSESDNGDPSLFNVDLYYVGYRSTATVVGTDAFGGTLVMEDYIDTDLCGAGSGIQSWSTDDTADGVLAGLIQDAYAGGAEAGDYIVLRVEPTDWSGGTAPTSKNFNRIYSADETTDSYKPLLTITTVPEPSTVALLATGLIGLLAYAWRKRK